MSTLFKKKWIQIFKDHPFIDLESLDFQINDMTLRMTEASSYQEWSNLYHERERTQIMRDEIARNL